MVVTAWILLVVSTLNVVRYLQTSRFINEANAKLGYVEYSHKTESKIVFYISILLIAITAGIIWGGN